MTALLLHTKLYQPPPRPNVVLRPRLIERLQAGLHRKLTLVCAPAGFGKTTLVSTWLAASDRPGAWLSLDRNDGDLIRFLTYLVGALQTVADQIGAEIVAMLESPQPPATDVLLTSLLNELHTIERPFTLVLDDYHLIEAGAVDDALALLIERSPPQMHVVITTREDPPLPLARLRARDLLNELRLIDLRFTQPECAGFLHDVMGLKLSAAEIATLETRTEGWIAGLQLAALSLQNYADTADLIQSFSGQHRFVLDYLVEEVLHGQPDQVQTFLLHTSILDRLCGSLCDAVLGDPSVSGQATLEYLQHANLFLVPLDNERRWYRYHHLFADVLRQRLHQRVARSTKSATIDVAELHRRASGWFEDHDLITEAFHHAVTAHDVTRAERLIDGAGLSLRDRGVVLPALRWLESLPSAVLDQRPSLWITYASALVFVGQIFAVEHKLQAAETAIQRVGSDDHTRDLIGRVAAIRATMALLYHDLPTMIDQSRRALDYLHPDNTALRVAAMGTLGYAAHLQGDRVAAREAYQTIIANDRSSSGSLYTIAAVSSLGKLQETDNQLPLAAETYRRVLQLAGDPPHLIACDAYLGLARIHYQWNDLEAADQFGQQCSHLTRQIESVETIVGHGVFLADLKQAHGDLVGALAALNDTEAYARQHGFGFRLPDIAAARVRVLMQQGKLVDAERLAHAYDLPISRARVDLQRGNAGAALATLDQVLQQAEVRGWPDQRLQALALQSLAYADRGDTNIALQTLAAALLIAEPGGFVRLFVDEGPPMATLLTRLTDRDAAMQRYIHTLLAAFADQISIQTWSRVEQPLVEPLSQREIEVLRLIAQGLSNREISERLVLALDTVKGHNRRIYDKLDVQRRTEAVARARELGLL